MNKATTFSALACVLIASASAASILARAAVPDASSAMKGPAVERPLAVRETKADKLGVASIPASDETADVASDETADVSPETAITASTEPAADRKIQLAYAADDAGGLPAGAIPEAATKTAPVAAAPATKLAPVIAAAPVHKPKPKVAAKPALLSDVQIAQIKTRLNLSSSQEYYWPSVEQALRAIGRKMNATHQVADRGPPPIDPDSAEVQQLKYAAMPLLFQLREDQKQEVRKLARTMGLEQVAQAI